MIKIGPVSLEKFSGRKIEFERLQKIKIDYLKGYRRNLALIGPLGIGKTSLVLKYIHEGLNYELFPIYLNLEEEFLKESFFGFLLFFLRRFSEAKHEHSIAGIDDIGQVIEMEYPNLAAEIKNIETNLKSLNPRGVLDSIFKLPKLIKNNFGKNCLFIIDEFFNFEKFKLETWMQLLREHIMLDRHILFILISSDVERAKSALNSELSLLFGNFELMELKSFSFQESLEFLMERIEKIKYRKEVLYSLISLTDGLPLYLDLLSNWITENLAMLDWEGLMLSLKENILENKGFLYRYFQEKLNQTFALKKREELLSFITEVARGYTRKRELKKKIKLSPIYDHSLNGFLEKSGSFYKIKDSLFRIWFLYAYRPDLMGLKFDLDKRLESLYEEIKNSNLPLSHFDVKDFSKDEFQNFIQVIFSKFDNEFIEIDGKKKLMPRFLKIEEMKVTDEYLVFKGFKQGGGRWLIVVFLTDVVEALIYRLLSELKNKFTSFSQKIIISIPKIDDNLQSILKAKGFWIWDSKFVENILEFYGISFKKKI